MFLEPEKQVFLPRLHRADYYFRGLIEECWRNIIGEENWPGFLQVDEEASDPDSSRTKWVDKNLYIIFGNLYEKFFNKTVRLMNTIF